jgi:hypothetical protein
MGQMLTSTFRPALLAAAFLFVTGGFACRSPDADALAKGMKAKMPLPLKVDDDTRLDDVRGISKKELGYFMTLTRMTKSQADADPTFRNLLESNIRGSACQNPNYVTLMKAGFTVRLTYTSSDGAEVRTFAIAPKDCGL